MIDLSTNLAKNGQVALVAIGALVFGAFVLRAFGSGHGLAKVLGVIVVGVISLLAIRDPEMFVNWLKKDVNKADTGMAVVVHAPVLDLSDLGVRA